MRPTYRRLWSNLLNYYPKKQKSQEKIKKYPQPEKGCGVDYCASLIPEISGAAIRE